MRFHTAWVILVEPGLGGILVRKDFEVVLVANLLASIDIDQNGHD